MTTFTTRSITITCGVRDRVAHLHEALPSWLARQEVSEILIVDWSSSERLLLPVDPRIRYVRVEGQRYWHASKCHNLELCLSSGAYVLRLDADIVLGSDFFTLHPMAVGTSRLYHYKYPIKYKSDVVLDGGDDVHLAGVVYARRVDMLAAGGYCERLRTYGREDDDFVRRLSAQVDETRALDVAALRHIPHGDDLRLRNLPLAEYPNLRPSERDARWCWGDRPVLDRSCKLGDEELAARPWNPERDRMATFSVVTGERVWEAREVTEPSSFQQQKAGMHLPDDERSGLDYSLRGTSIVCGCRDRAADLGAVITSWAADERVTEIVIVDWSSRPAHAEVVSELASKAAASRLPDKLLRVVLVRVAGEATWQPGPCFNLGLRFATQDKILKLDADVALRCDDGRALFLGEHVLCERDFFAGDWLRARDDNERHLSGVVYARRHDLLAVNGWSEKIVTYGGDDTDLYERLTNHPHRRGVLNNDTLYHIPHSDNIRLQCQPGRVNSCKMENEFNNQLVRSKPWKRNDALVLWQARQLSRPDHVEEFEARRRP